MTFAAPTYLLALLVIHLIVPHYSPAAVQGDKA